MKTSLLSFLFLLLVQSSFAATYTVPVEEELKDYANFDLEDFKISEYSGAIAVKYKIPTLLTGVEQEVEFRGTIDTKNNTNILIGSNGVLTCSREVEVIKMECKVEYKELKFDQEKAIDLINKISSSPSEFMGRLTVMKSFSSDPVGFIHY